MRHGISVVTVTVAAVLGGCAGFPKSDAGAIVGYLGPDTIGMIAATVPSPPADGSADALVEQIASDRYRVLEDTDRWYLATLHAELRAPEATQHFDCALGMRIASTPAPSLTRIMDRLLQDIEGATAIAKARAFSARPSADPDRRTCQTVSDAGRKSAGYPSSSASAGTAYGELMAELAPDGAVEARRIGREIGLSRLVCGMHYPAQVKAGADLGLAVWTAARQTQDFARDLEPARAELAAARTAGLSNPGCAAERLALSASLP